MSLRTLYQTLSNATRHPGDWEHAFRAVFHPDVQINVVHPINDVAGIDAFLKRFLTPLMTSFSNLYRRDDIVMVGAFDGQDWVSSTGYWVGQFDHPWLGIQPTGQLTYLRYGEFHRVADGVIVESYIFLDIPELMISVGQWPIMDSPGLHRGHTGMIHGPASQDGVMWQDQDAAESAKSYQIVTDMLAGLATHDEAWRPYWRDNMMWYGPAAFGSFVGIDAFASFQVPFEGAFEGWSGGSAGNGMTQHFTRYGDGMYTCSGGWPSLTGVQIKPFLDQPATHKRVFMRVCDWWRREDDLLVENWVFVDIPHVLTQLGYDVFKEIRT
ncbi:MAG: ester cyclase [Pseudomonadota bacterium]